RVWAPGDPYAPPDGAEAVEASYAPLPVLADLAAARAAGAPRVHDDLVDNLLFERSSARGDADGAFARAAFCPAETFHHDRVSAAPLEPRAMVALWEGERLVLWINTQVPHI